MHAKLPVHGGEFHGGAVVTPLLLVQLPLKPAPLLAHARLDVRDEAVKPLHLAARNGENLLLR